MAWRQEQGEQEPRARGPRASPQTIQVQVGGGHQPCGAGEEAQGSAHWTGPGGTQALSSGADPAVCGSPSQAPT